MVDSIILLSCNTSFSNFTGRGPTLRPRRDVPRRTGGLSRTFRFFLLFRFHEWSLSPQCSDFHQSTLIDLLLSSFCFPFSFFFCFLACLTNPSSSLFSALLCCGVHSHPPYSIYYLSCLYLFVQLTTTVWYPDQHSALSKFQGCVCSCGFVRETGFVWISMYSFYCEVITQTREREREIENSEPSLMTGQMSHVDDFTERQTT